MPAKTPEKTPALGNLDLTQVAKENQKQLARMLHLNQQMIRDGLRFQAELLDFARRRLGAEIATQDRLAQCHTMDDAAKVMNEFCTTALRDYTEEAAGLVQFGMSVATDAAQGAAEIAKPGQAAAKPAGPARGAAGGSGTGKARAAKG